MVKYINASSEYNDQEVYVSTKHGTDIANYEYCYSVDKDLYESLPEDIRTTLMESGTLRATIDDGRKLFAYDCDDQSTIKTLNDYSVGPKHTKKFGRKDDCLLVYSY